MKNFSNESKKRCKAIGKTILKRYVLPPALLIAFYLVGLVFFMLLNIIVYEKIDHKLIYGIVGIFSNTFMGFLIVSILFILGLCINDLWKDLIEYMKKGTLVHDIIEFFRDMGKYIISCGRFIAKLPKKIYDRIKSEPERFKSALNKEMQKQE